MVDLSDSKSFDLSFKDVDITNYFMFSYVMQDKKICIELLKFILPEYTIDHIEYYSIESDIKAATKSAETQKTIIATADRRFVRLDAYIDDGKSIINIEMQTGAAPELPKRMRMNQAHIDVHQLQHGQQYDQLKPCYIIFICKYDPFKKGQYK